MARILSLLHFSTSRCICVLKQNRECKGWRGELFLSGMDLFFPTNRLIQRHPLSLPVRQNTGFFCSLHQPLTLKFPLSLWPRGTPILLACCKLWQTCLWKVTVLQHFGNTIFIRSLLFHMYFFWIYTWYALRSVTPFTTGHECAQKGWTLVQYQHVIIILLFQ